MSEQNNIPNTPQGQPAQPYGQPAQPYGQPAQPQYPQQQVQPQYQAPAQPANNAKDDLGVPAFLRRGGK